MSDCLLDYLEHRTPEGLRKLVEETRDEVRRVAFRILRDSALAEDVSQEVYLLSARGSWRPEDVRSGRRLINCLAARLSFSTLRRRLRSERREMAHARARSRRAPGGVEHDQPRSPGLSPEERLDLTEAMARLPDPERECVRVALARGLNARELGRELGIPGRTAQARLARARQLLRRRLGRDWWPALLVGGRGRGLTGTARLSRGTRTLRGVIDWLRPVAWILGGGILLGALLPGVAQPRRLTGLVSASIPGGPFPLAARSPADSDAALARAPVSELAGSKAGRALASRGILPSTPRDSPPERVLLFVRGSESGLLREGTLQLLLSSASTSRLHREWSRQDLSQANPVVAELPPGGTSGGLVARVRIPGLPGLEAPVVRTHRQQTLIVPEAGRLVVRLLNAATLAPEDRARIVIVPGLFPGGERAAGQPVTARSLGAGIHEARGLGSGPVEVQVTGAELEPVLRERVVPESQREVVIHVHSAPSARVATVVVAASSPGGAPASGARVVLTSGGESLELATGPDGRTPAAPWPPGPFRARWVDPPDLHAGEPFVLEKEVVARPGRPTIVFLGGPAEGHTLVVEVVEECGAPGVGIPVVALGPVEVAGITDARGSARLVGAPPGDYQVVLCEGGKGGAGNRWIRDRAVQVEKGALETTLRVQRGSARVEGRVVTQALSGLHVRLRSSGWSSVVGIDSGGEWQASSVPAGDLEVALVVAGGGLAPSPARRVKIEPGGRLGAVALRLEGQAILHVELSRPDGSPVARASIVGRPRGSLHTSGEAPAPVRFARRQTGRRGLELAAMLPPGETRLEVSADGCQPLPCSIAVGPGEEVWARASVISPGQIQWRVLPGGGD